MSHSANSNRFHELETFGVIVHASRRWIDAIRSRLHGYPVRLFHTATRSDFVRACNAVRESVAIIELGTHPVIALQLIESIATINRDATVWTIGRARDRSIELAARELGSLAYLTEPDAARELFAMLDILVRKRVLARPSASGSVSFCE